MKKIFYPLAALIFLFVFWELAVYFYQDQRLILPSPSAVILRLFKNSDRFLYHAKITFLEMIGGLFLAFSIAFPIGFLMYAKQSARLVLQPLLVFIQCVPMFALAPIMVLFFGWSYTAIVIPTALMIFFPLTISIYQGLKSTPQELIDYFKINRATVFQIFYKLQLPWSLPHLFSGFRVSAAIAGIGAIAGEFAGAQAGLGILMLESRRATDLETTFAALFCLSFMSMGFYLLILILENRMIKKRIVSKVFTTLMIVTGLLISGCSNQSPENHQTTRLLLDWLPNPNHVPLYVGIKKEIFKKHGIDLTIQKIPDPSDAIPYLVAEKADLALFYMPDTIRAMQASIPLEPVAILFKQPLNAIIYREDEGIDKPSDLNGKVIGYSVDGNSTAVLDYILEKNRIVPSQKQNVSFDLVGTLCTKQVDAIYGAYWNIECEHMSSLNQKTKHFDLVELGYPGYYELIVVAHQSRKEAAPEFQVRLKKAMQESIDYSVQHPDEAFAIYISENQDKSEKTIAWEKASWNRTYPVLAPDQNFEPDVMDNLTKWLSEIGSQL